MFFRKKKAEAKKPTAQAEKPKSISGIFRDSYVDPRADRAAIITDAINRNFREPQPFVELHKGKGIANPIMTMDSGYDNLQKAQLMQPNIPDILVQWYGMQGFIGFQFCAILAQHWLVNKACSIPARDAVRTGYKISMADGEALTPEDAAKLKLLNTEYKLDWNLEQFARFNRIFGIRIAIFKKRNADALYYQNPFNPDGIKEGDYEGIAQVDPYWCTPVLDFKDGADPSAINFYDPTWWVINGVKYHRSHLCIIRGDEVPDLLKPTYIYAGMSLPQKIYERVYSSERTANEAPMLAQTKRLNVLKMDTTQGITNSEELMQTFNTMNMFRDNYGWRVCGLNEEISQLDTSLTDLDAIIMTQYQLVAAIANVPITKLLGTVPKGFNSTGEYDEANYHEELESIQTHELQPLIDRHLLMLSLSSEDFRGRNLIATWNELDTPTKKEAAETRLIDAQADQIYSNAGAIDGEDIRNRLAADPGSGYTGIQAKEILEPENEDDEPPVDENTDDGDKAETGNGNN